MNKKLAFTLIELLVVIAVIGILSGLIVVSMSGTSQKATIAKAQIFSNSLRNSLMSDMVSQWKFDEASGTTAYDFWGGNNATLSGTVLPQITTAGCVYGNCLYLDGANSYLSVANVNNLKFSTGTASIWFKWSNLTKSYGTLFSISDKDSNRCMNVAVGNWTGSYDDESVGFFYLNSNWILQAFYRNGHFFYRDSNWHHLVFTVGSNYNYLYIDGQK